MKAHTIYPDGQVREGEIPQKEFPTAMLRELVGGDIEYVAVIFDEKPATMIVNERGGVMNPPLAINARATAIYWTATAQGITGIAYEPLKAPMIYGTAVLIEHDLRTL